MAAQYKGVPEGASAVIPRLVCRDVEGQIEFCSHAMLKFGPAMLMLEAERPTLPSRAPNPDGSSPVVIYLYVEDVDTTVERALKRGGKLVVPVEAHFWGDRMGWIQDPAGHMWTIATRVEETTEDQRRERWSKTMAEQS
jgi:PhnB protein